MATVLVLWVEVVVVDFMHFFPDGRGGFFQWWWWVSCGKGGGNGWLKESERDFVSF